LSRLRIPRIPTRVIRIENGQWKKPPTGKQWIVLTGVINHVNGTNSVLLFCGGTTNDIIDRIQIQSTETGGVYPMFNNYTNTNGLLGSPWRPIIINDDWKGINFAGASTAVAIIEVIEI